MGWNVEKDDQGAPIWRGQESIINAHADSATLLKWLGIVFVVGCLAPSACNAGVSRVTDGLNVLFAFIGIAGGACISVAFIAGYRTQKWFGRTWSLVADSGALSYQAGAADGLPAESWRVSVDQIATVEAGRTVDWRPSRVIHNIRYEPDHEWQTFLILTDQTRRAVHHANADREGCAALAASIRAHVEAARAAAPAPLAATAPAGDGFNL